MKKKTFFEPTRLYSLLKLYSAIFLDISLYFHFHMKEKYLVLIKIHSRDKKVMLS